MLGSPPPCLAAMMMARLSLLHSLPRLASTAPFLCLIVAQWECPDMTAPPVRVQRLRRLPFYSFLPTVEAQTKSSPRAGEGREKEHTIVPRYGMPRYFCVCKLSRQGG